MVWDIVAETFPVFVTPDGPDRGEVFTAPDAARDLNRAIGGNAADNEAHVSICFPETGSTGGALIEIRPGTEVSNIDIDANPLPIRHVQDGSPAFLQLDRTARENSVSAWSASERTDSIFIVGASRTQRRLRHSRVSGGSYILFWDR
jgi:hypothetical protein